MYDENAETIFQRRYRGMNPDFVKMVWAKRRAQAAQARKRPLICSVKPEPMIEADVEEPLANTSPVPQQEVSTEEIVSHFRVITFGDSRTSRPTGREIIKEVCRARHIDVEVVLGKSRCRTVVAVRQEAMAAIYRIRPDYSLPQIGRLFNRDHTTVIHSLMRQGIHDSQTGGNRALSVDTSQAA